MIHWHLWLYKNHVKSHSVLLTQLCMRKIDFNQFLHERWIFNVVTTMCKCNKDWMLIKHILLTCFRWKVEWKAMQWEENITNLRKLLEIMSAATTIIQMILSTSILNKFQAVTSLKNQMKERENKEEIDSYSFCIENSYNIECRKKRFLMRKKRCASAALATVYRILHRLIMSVELSKN